MTRRFIEKAQKILQWGKLFLPLSSMRYYPPQFILRNPIVSGVKSAFRGGYEVGVIAFNIKNLKELADQLGSLHYPKFIKAVKKMFQYAVEQEIIKDDLISLSDIYGDGIHLFIKVDYERHYLSEIDGMINKILFEVERNIKIQYPSVLPQFETGYMFVEKNLHSVEDAIARAQRQANSISEKKAKSDFNEMVFTMKKIIFQKEIILLAQPIIDVATNKTRAWEFLTRGPKGTILENPLPLFSVARQTGTLYDLEMVVLEKAFQKITETGCQQDIFVNCTPLTLGNIRFIRDLKAMIQSFKGLSPKQIVLEVTERDSIDEMKDLRYNIRILRLMGFRFAVDDTGAGYSSLNTINEILPDIIKIDRSVIENIDKNSVKESMLKGLLLVAQEAGSLVVAEGIENKDEASVLVRNKVHLAQGYFYARPGALLKDMVN